jgi:hypothetical protein
MFDVHNYAENPTKLGTKARTAKNYSIIVRRVNSEKTTCPVFRTWNKKHMRRYQIGQQQSHSSPSFQAKTLRRYTSTSWTKYRRSVHK